MVAYVYVSKESFQPVQTLVSLNDSGVNQVLYDSGPYEGLPLPLGEASNGINIFTGDAIPSSTNYITPDQIMPNGPLAAEALGMQFIAIRAHEGAPGGAGAISGFQYSLLVEGQEFATPLAVNPATGTFNEGGAIASYNMWIINSGFSIDGDLVYIPYTGDLGDAEIPAEFIGNAWNASSTMPGAVGVIMLPYGAYNIKIIDGQGESIVVSVNGGYNPYGINTPPVI